MFNRTSFSPISHEIPGFARPPSSQPTDHFNGPRPQLGRKQRRQDPEYKLKQRSKLEARLQAHRQERLEEARKRSDSAPDTSNWTIGQLRTEVENIHIDDVYQCLLNTTGTHLSPDDPIDGLPLFFQWRDCQPIARLAPPNATQVRVIAREDLPAWLDQAPDLIEDQATLLVFSDFEDMKRQLEPWLASEESVFIGVQSDPWYQQCEAWLLSKAKNPGNREVIYVHSTRPPEPAPQPSPVPEPQLRARSSDDASQAIWGGVAVAAAALVVVGVACALGLRPSDLFNFGITRHCADASEMAEDSQSDSSHAQDNVVDMPPQVSRAEASGQPVANDPLSEAEDPHSASQTNDQ